jgi:hypothetical protein
MFLVHLALARGDALPFGDEILGGQAHGNFPGV